MMQKKTLFDFQKKAYDDCLDFLLNSSLKSGLAVLPTAAGKAFLMAKISQSLSKNTLFIVPSVDLLRQNEQELLLEGADVGIYCGSLNRKEIKPITLATVNSLKDADEFKALGFTYIIVDEAHYKCSEDGTFKKFVDAMKPKKLLGLTATAFKLKTMNGFYSLNMLTKIKPNIFKDIVHVTQVSDVINAKRWSELEYENHLFDGSKLVINSSGTEFTKESIEEVNLEKGVNRSLVKRLKQIIEQDPTSKTLVFTDSIKTASIIEEWVNKTFNIKCAFINDKTSSKEREVLVDEFKDVNSGTNVLINFGTFTTGLDAPSLKYCILGRATMSFALYYQIVGRLVRVHPDKKKGVFIDFCGNIDRFGRVENITYKHVEGFGWCVFSNGKLMTGVPVVSERRVTENDLLNPPPLKQIDYSYKMPFGKYQGQLVARIPKFARDYMLKTFDLTNYLKLKQLLEDLNDNDFNKLLIAKKRG